MKTVSLLPVAILGLLSGCAGFGTPSPKAPSRTEVVFDHPENFRDVKDESSPTEKGTAYILSQLREFLEDRATSALPEGYHLKVVFTDIDLAGDFEPWRGPEWSNVRIVKAIYPPAFKFSYTVTDASGKVVREGNEDIRDLSFDTRITPDPSDRLHYEKSILEDWVHSKLQGLK